MEVIKGDLIKLALEGEFDVIVHGCNCFCTQKSGIAKQMVETFHTNDDFLFEKENDYYKGDINKLGTIDYAIYSLYTNKMVSNRGYHELYSKDSKHFHVVNAYTQFYHLRNLPEGETRPFSYIAFALVLKKLNHIFKGKHIGMPWIGCGLGGADKQHVAMLIKKNLTDCKVTVVEYEKD